ncbi:NAD(P)H-binding protein [Streptomyces hydrogenans]|uniref:NAD(P)H-binding protein n=1 Tax=Streptomyces hydrogenans TaxID=1873719 RepID=UPI00364C880F
MILITGATGTIGSHVARLLTEQEVPFRAMSRRAQPGGVQADFDDPASLARAVAGVDAVFLVTVPPVPTAAHDLALLEAARAAGVRKIVKLSAIGSGKTFDGATVAALTGDAHDGRRYDLSGPELLTFADQAAILEGVLARPVDVTDVPTLDQVPAAMATGVAWARAGGAAYLTDHVPRILGRPAGTFEQWAHDHREAFTNPRE